MTVQPPQSNLPPTSSAWAKWVESRLSTALSLVTEARQTADRAGATASSSQNQSAGQQVQLGDISIVQDELEEISQLASATADSAVSQITLSYIDPRRIDGIGGWELSDGTLVMRDAEEEVIDALTPEQLDESIWIGGVPVDAIWKVMNAETDLELRRFVWDGDQWVQSHVGSDSLDPEVIGNIDAAVSVAGNASDAAQQAQNAVTALAGQAVIDFENEYAVDSSDTTPPVTGWGTEQPVPTPGMFIWVRTKIYFGDESSTTTDPVLVLGGVDGLDGVGVVSVTTYYQQSATQPAQPANDAGVPAGWTTTEPGFDISLKLWTIVQVVFTSGSITYAPVNESSSRAGSVYVANMVGKTVIVSSTTPSRSFAGQLWWKSGTAGQFEGLYFNDGSAWVPYQIVANDLIAANSVTANNIDIQDLFAKQVLVSGGNLLVDPFVRDVSFWSGPAVGALITNGGYRGGNAWQLSASSLWAARYTGPITGPMEYSVQTLPGAQYKLSIMFSPSAGSTVTGDKARIYCRWYDEAGTQVGPTQYLSQYTNQNVAANSWYELKGITDPCPAGASRLIVGAAMGFSPATYPTGTTGLFSNFVCVEAANAVTIANGALDAFQITSPLIQSVATANQGIKWVGDTITGYTNTGAVGFHLDGGAATIQGGFIEGSVIDGGLVRGAEFELKTEQAPSTSTAYSQNFNTNTTDGWTATKQFSATGTYTVSRAASGGRTGGALQIVQTGEAVNQTDINVLSNALVQRTPKINLALGGEKKITMWVKATADAQVTLHVTAYTATGVRATFYDNHIFMNKLLANVWTKFEVVVPEGFATSGNSGDFSLQLSGGASANITYLIDDITITTTYYGSQQIFIHQNDLGYPELVAYGSDGESVVVSTRTAGGYAGLSIYPPDPQTTPPIILSQEGIGRVIYQEGTQITSWAALAAAARDTVFINGTAYLRSGEFASVPVPTLTTVAPVSYGTIELPRPYAPPSGYGFALHVIRTARYPSIAVGNPTASPLQAKWTQFASASWDANTRIGWTLVKLA